MKVLETLHDQHYNKQKREDQGSQRELASIAQRDEDMYQGLNQGQIKKMKIVNKVKNLCDLTKKKADQYKQYLEQKKNKMLEEKKNESAGHLDGTEALVGMDLQ